MERRFIDLTNKEASSLLEADTFAFWGRQLSAGWDEILRSRRILIMSEAGAGKTYECQRQQERQFQDGEPAFFFELSELARCEKAASLLLPEQFERFNFWKEASDIEATFFLDAYDELKLTRGKFRTALLNLRNLIGPYLDRVKLIVTSRPGPFELELLSQLFPLRQTTELATSFVDDVMGTGTTSVAAPQIENTPPATRTVCLVPLDEADVRDFVDSTGLPDADGFLSELLRRDAFVFTRRPQDLIELCQDWRDHREIRSHREQVETNVIVKLKPRTDRAEPEPLSDARAREGAGCLALAALLMKRFTIRHGLASDEAVDSGPALDPSRILPGWTSGELQTLLERPLFSFASFGRVRFHHRSVLEYLAAERLVALHRSGMTLRALKRIVFAQTQQGVDVVRPSFRPVAAWLSLTERAIFDETLKREPESLISLGDPSSFSLEKRETILTAFVDRYREGAWRGVHVPAVQTRRFADTRLGPHARQIWESGVTNGEMREFLLELATAAPLAELADAAVAIFLDVDAPDGERLEALNVILRLNDERIPTIVDTLAREPGRWTNRVLQFATVQMFPTHVGGDHLRSILAAIKPSKASLDAITWNFPDEIREADLSPEAICDLRKMLHELVSEGATWQRAGHHLQSPRPHLIPALAAACSKELISGADVEVVVDAAVAAVRFMQDSEYDEERPVKSLRRKISEFSPEDRAKVFWADDALMQSIRPQDDVSERFFQVAFDNAALSIDPEKDRPWVIAAIADTQRPDVERHLALHVAMKKTQPEEAAAAPYWDSLRSAVEDLPELLADLDRYLTPTKPHPKMVAWAKKRERAKAKEDRKAAKDRKAWQKFQQRVLADPDAAFSEGEVGNTRWNLWTGMKRGAEFSEIGWNREFIERHFNKNIADRLRSALMDYWRSIKPPLEYERPPEDRGTFYYSWHLALAGIYAEAEDPNWAKALSKSEAEQAARIASTKLNGLPHWLADIAAAQPDVVANTLVPDFVSELAEGKSWSRYLQGLREDARHLRDMFIPPTVDWMQGYFEPKPDDAPLNLLQQALTFLLAEKDEGIDSLLRELAINALQGSMEEPAAITWAEVLLGLDPELGTAELERLFGASPAPSNELRETWIAQIFGDRHGRGIPVDLGAPEFTPELLLRLVLLAYEHVRATDDLHHEGAFSPGRRDNAQTGRNELLGALLDREGPEAWRAKLQLADDPLLAHFRDRALALAREKSASEADRSSLTESEAAKLLSRFEVGPKTTEDMFSLLSDRLDDVADMLLGDTSPRELWAGIDKEHLLRRAIAHELEGRANGVYRINQEAVTADEKETDIRLSSTTSELEGVIELKRAEGFSGRVLRDTIFDQLVNKYLAPENRRAGFLVITIASKSRFEHPDTGDRLTPEEFLELLQAEAKRIEEQLGFQARIGVRFLDLRPRLDKG